MPEPAANRIIISDTSCLIGLTNIGLLDVLRRLYESVTVTPEVAAEYAEPLPDWIRVVSADAKKTKAFSAFVDMGESSAIALATETNNALVIIDDLAARRFAVDLGLEVTGTLGVLLQAHARGLLPDYHAIISSLRTIGFRLPANAEQLAA